jgi:glycosyltransferase involved in cell wall biosynthesis
VFGEKSAKDAVDSKLSQKENSRSLFSDIEILLWAGGDRPQVEDALQHTLSRLVKELPDSPIAFLLDGPEWQEVIRPFLPRFSKFRQLSLPSATDQPQLLYSMGLLSSEQPFATFLWPGCNMNVEGLAALRGAAEEADLVYGDVTLENEKEGDPPLPSRFMRQRSGRKIPEEFIHPVQYGCLQMLDCVPMHNCLISRQAIKKYGTFDPSPWLQELFWWDFTRRLSRNGKMIHRPSPDPGTRWSWRDYPFRHRLKGIDDQAIRYLGVPGRCFKDEEICALPGKEISGPFLEDLGSAQAAELTREVVRWRASLDPDSEAQELPSASGTESARADMSIPGGKWPLKVTVLSGLYDPHNNQLCFYNYFERLAGRGLINWRAIVYETCLPSDLEGNDLVIFSRPRYPEAIALIDYCRRNRIPTLLMIDDNWIAAGVEFARYKSLFTPGCSAFEVFLYGLRHTDATIVYNERLEEDIRPYARRIFRMPVNVDTAHFSGSPREEKTFIAGFAGSPRLETAAFRALARFIRDRQEASIFIMAHQVPDELTGVPSDRIRFIPYQYSYFSYARTVSSVRPDVLLAPLDRSRFSASKCPNKYLETAAIGSPGIYSRVPPYTDYVKDGETGILVENEEGAWLDALELLYRSPDLRSRIVETARSDVRQRFSTERLVSTFLRILQDVVTSAKTE